MDNLWHLTAPPYAKIKKKVSYEFSLMIARLATGEEGLTILTFLVAIE